MNSYALLFHSFLNRQSLGFTLQTVISLSDMFCFLYRYLTMGIGHLLIPC